MESSGTLAPTPTDGSRTAARTLEQVGSGVHSAIDRISDAAHPAVDRVASGAHQAVDKITSVAGQAAETLGVKGEQLKEAQGRAMQLARDYVRDNPVVSLGIAIAAGFLLSRLLSSR